MKRCNQILGGPDSQEQCPGPAEVTITFASWAAGPPTDFDTCKECADVIIGLGGVPHPLYLRHAPARKQTDD